MDPSWVSTRIRSQELSMVPEFGTYLAKHQHELFYPGISNKSPRLQTNMPQHAFQKEKSNLPLILTVLWLGFHFLLSSKKQSSSKTPPKRTGFWNSMEFHYVSIFKSLTNSISKIFSFWHTADRPFTIPFFETLKCVSQFALKHQISLSDIPSNKALL